MKIVLSRRRRRKVDAFVAELKSEQTSISVLLGAQKQARAAGRRALGRRIRRICYLYGDCLCLFLIIVILRVHTYAPPYEHAAIFRAISIFEYLRYFGTSTAAGQTRHRGENARSRRRKMKRESIRRLLFEMSDHFEPQSGSISSLAFFLRAPRNRICLSKLTMNITTK